MAKGSPRSHVAFSCLVSFVFLDLEYSGFFCLFIFLFFYFLPFITLTSLKSMGQLFCRMPFNLDLPDVFS